MNIYKGIRYNKQLNRSECGPVAVLNILKWSGIKATYKRDIKAIRKQCCWTKEGTTGEDLLDAIKEYKHLQIRYTEKNYSLTEIKKHLLNNGAVIICHKTIRPNGKVGGHFATLIGFEHGKYLIVNRSEYDDLQPKDTIEFYDGNFIRKILKRADDKYYAFVVYVDVKEKYKGDFSETR